METCWCSDEKFEYEIFDEKTNTISTRTIKYDTSKVQNGKYIHLYRVGCSTSNKNERRAFFTLSPTVEEKKEQLTETRKLMGLINAGNFKVSEDIAYLNVLDKIAKQEDDKKLPKQVPVVIEAEAIEKKFKTIDKRFKSEENFLEKKYEGDTEKQGQIVKYMKDNPFIIYFAPQNRDYDEPLGYNYPWNETNFLNSSIKLKVSKNWNRRDDSIAKHTGVSFFAGKGELTVLSPTRWIPISSESVDVLELMLKQAVCEGVDEVIVLMPNWLYPSDFTGREVEKINSFYEEIVNAVKYFKSYFKRITVVSCCNKYGSNTRVFYHGADEKNDSRNKQQTDDDDDEEVKEKDDANEDDLSKVRKVITKLSKTTRGEITDDDDDEDSEDITSKSMKIIKKGETIAEANHKVHSTRKASKMTADDDDDGLEVKKIKVPGRSIRSASVASKKTQEKDKEKLTNNNKNNASKLTKKTDADTRKKEGNTSSNRSTSVTRTNKDNDAKKANLTPPPPPRDSNARGGSNAKPQMRNRSKTKEKNEENSNDTQTQTRKKK